MKSYSSEKEKGKKKELMTPCDGDQIDIFLCLKCASTNIFSFVTNVIQNCTTINKKCSMCKCSLNEMEILYDDIFLVSKKTGELLIPKNYYFCKKCDWDPIRKICGFRKVRVGYPEISSCYKHYCKKMHKRAVIYYDFKLIDDNNNNERQGESEKEGRRIKEKEAQRERQGERKNQSEKETQYESEREMQYEGETQCESEGETQRESERETQYESETETQCEIEKETQCCNTTNESSLSVLWNEIFKNIKCKIEENNEYIKKIQLENDTLHQNLKEKDQLLLKYENENINLKKAENNMDKEIILKLKHLYLYSAELKKSEKSIQEKNNLIIEIEEDNIQLRKKEKEQTVIIENLNNENIKLSNKIYKLEEKFGNSENENIDLKDENVILKNHNEELENMYGNLKKMYEDLKKENDNFKIENQNLRFNIYDLKKEKNQKIKLLEDKIYNLKNTKR